MTNEQREKIQELRGHGYGYATIAGAVGLSKDSVKAFCRKNNLGGVVAETNARIDLTCGVCLNCGKQLQQAPGRKKIKFCSAAVQLNHVMDCGPSLPVIWNCLKPWNRAQHVKPVKKPKLK